MKNAFNLTKKEKALTPGSKSSSPKSNFYLQLRTLFGIISILGNLSYAAKEVSTNSFYVRIKPQSHEHPAVTAHNIARRNGFVNVGTILGSPNEYHFVNHALPQARTKRSVPHIRKLKADPLVEHAFQQSGFKRDKRYGLSRSMRIQNQKQKPRNVALSKDQDSNVIHDENFYNRLQHSKSTGSKRGYNPLRVENLVDLPPISDPTDPLFEHQWYLKNDGQNGGKPKLDLNVQAAWAQGVTGKNVTTAIMDDGVDYIHPDIAHNYNARASYDFSSNDPYPYPRYTDDWFNSHGTRCAGEVSGARDNGICGVGVAYDSMVAGIRMLDQPYMTDLIEANSMGHEPNLIDIYSASWGPTDDGRTVDGPRNATMRAIVRGVNEGRNGKGNIYVWASGDGGEEDDCNCDGYAASMWTISINSAINTGENAHYDESCSSTLASTFSNGAKDPNTGVATTDLYGKCTRTHSGTSAAAPEAAGVFALALEANRQLTWRDMQHLTVLTSKRNSLFDSKGRFHWTMNGVGLEFNHLFGFGVLDAGAMLDQIKQFEKFQVPKSLFLTIETDACAGKDTEVNYLEHVQAVITVNSTRRGDVELFLRSPMGTRSMILSNRPNDDDGQDGFTKWPFMTSHTWAEYPRGKWTLEARFHGERLNRGFLKEWTLMLHGTRDAPYSDLPVTDPHSKLAIVKKAHEDKKKNVKQHKLVPGSSANRNQRFGLKETQLLYSFLEEEEETCFLSIHLISSL
ncbi:PCSK2 [Lepeophtheirus salmonis]|uniref:Neuroendocrine convertase 2 n=1 Tax=Lepeophtheirus salmonis TaxID=72036 RepID=A0A7R8D220_LEPSM|nr:PCSK2 [Lepeophtheirus salmonis]CAF2999002.1 PCSK2 [Lepeophtheirus salmonis]